MSAILPLTYADLVCDLDLDPFAAETTSDFQNLVQDLTHVLQENLGSNPDDPNRGVGIMNYLSGTEAAFVGLTGIIETQFLKDDRVSTCSVTINQNALGYTISCNIGVGGQIVPVQFSWTSQGLNFLS